MDGQARNCDHHTRSKSDRYHRTHCTRWESRFAFLSLRNWSFKIVRDTRRASKFYSVYCIQSPYTNRSKGNPHRPFSARCNYSLHSVPEKGGNKSSLPNSINFSLIYNVRSSGHLLNKTKQFSFLPPFYVKTKITRSAFPVSKFPLCFVWMCCTRPLARFVPETDNDGFHGTDELSLRNGFCSLRRSGFCWLILRFFVARGAVLLFHAIAFE